MTWEPACLTNGSLYILYREAAHRHLDAARDHALAGDLDAAVDALHDLQALHAELREPGPEHDDESGKHA